MDFVGLHDVDIEHDHNYHLVHQESNIANHDHNYVMQQHIIVEVNEPEQLPDAAVDLVTPRTYTSVFGVKRGSEILRDSFGFLNYKNKITENKIYLVCYEKKLEGRCRAAAHVSHNQNDNRLCLSKAHNHIVRPFNLDVPMLREHITQMSMAKTMHPRNPRETYMDAIVKFPEAALLYTFVQSAERIRRMKSRSFPQTPQNMAHFHELLMTAGNEDFLGTLQNPPNRLYQGPLMVDHQICGTIFCNTTNVQLLENDLRHVRVAGCDGTFKTVPKFLHNDAYQMFTFQVIYQNVLSVFCVLTLMLSYNGQLQILDNQQYVEFHQCQSNLRIRRGTPNVGRTLNTNAIRDFLQELSVNRNPNRILTFLRKAGHRVDGYINNEIGIHPDEEEIMF